MAFVKRIFFFALVNIAMMVTINFVLYLLGIDRYAYRYGIDLNYTALAVYCLVWGMGISLLSLAMSRMIAKWTMSIQLVDVNSPGEFGEVARTVQRLARAAHLPMPEVGIYDSPELNAFATGPSKNRALVAVSTGLLRGMRPNEIEGVLGHELSHVANGDMVTMTLIQGVVNAFVMFLARILAFAASQALASRNDRDSGRGSPMMQWMFTMLFEVIFGLVGAMIVASFSRWREYRADRGGALLAGREAMQAALRRLLANQEAYVHGGNQAIAALKINGRQGGLMALLASHPPLEERIARLNQ